jgi:hypothetical protein
MDVTAVRDALAAQITANTGLRSMAQPRDQISPPVAVVMPGSPLVSFGDTLDGALTMNLVVTVIMSDAAPVEKTQRALDSYLGIGRGEEVSLAQAIMADMTLGGVVQWCVPTTITTYGRIEYAGELYFGGRMNFQLGAI